MRIRSPAFEPGQSIPKKHTGEGANSSPPLKWEEAPQGTREFALICDDPDAPGDRPWIHWVLYGIPGDTRELAEDNAGRAKEGKNNTGELGYTGPMPPPGHGVHHYHFKLYALDSPVDLDRGASKSELLKTMEGHILGQSELIGTYER
ncbi:MAG: YbhB/YbcL family Raf kinase inhibitor-like protein [Candidatus Eisenbacteria bacterium]|nr:YbhB/YbcL family Raf kinase inhibitor-like protein [Candidatus Eisenbacteria bacterium]